MSIFFFMLHVQVQKIVFFLKKKKVFWRTHVLFGGHWYPCFGFLVTSPLGFKARVGSALFAIFAEANVMYIPQDSPLVLHLPTSWRPARSRSLPPIVFDISPALVASDRNCHGAFEVWCPKEVVRFSSVYWCEITRGFRFRYERPGPSQRPIVVADINRKSNNFALSSLDWLPVLICVTSATNRTLERHTWPCSVQNEARSKLIFWFLPPVKSN